MWIFFFGGSFISGVFWRKLPPLSLLRLLLRLSFFDAVDAVAVVAAAVVAFDAVGVGVHLSDHRPLVRLGFEAELVEIHDR